MSKHDPLIFSILKKNKDISKETAIKNNISNKIISNLPSWLDFSSKEWVPSKSNPFLVKDDDSITNCQLCNQKIKWKYKLVNELNDKTIWVGGNCVQKFSQLKSLKKIVSTPKELERYNNLLEKYPDMFNIFVSNTTFLDNTDILLPSYYQKEYQSIEKQLKSISRKYIKKGVQINHSEFYRKIKAYNILLTNIHNFIDKNINNINYLPRKIIYSIQRQQKEDYQDIKFSIENNNGKISLETSSKIKVENYLELFKDIINLKFSKSKVTITNILYGTYILSIKYKNYKLDFFVPSDFLLKKHLSKGGFIFPESFSDNMEHFKIYNTETNNKLFLIGNNHIKNQSLLSIFEPNIKKIISIYDTDLTSKEYKELYSKISAILSQYLILQNNQDKKLLIYSNNTIIELGKLILFKKDNIWNDEGIQMFEEEFNKFISGQIL